jgi:hypothetical protein
VAIIKRFPRLQIPGWKADPHLIPQISDPMDDEFDAPDGLLNSSWTPTSTVLSYDVNRTMPHHLAVKLDGTASNRLTLYKSITEASTFSYTAHVFMPAKYVNTSFQFRIASADWLYLIHGAIKFDNTYGQIIEFNNMNNNVWGTADTRITRTWHEEWYIQLQYDGGNSWQPWFSSDGISWNTAFQPRTQAITKAYLFLGYYQTGSSYLSNTWMASDFVRRNWRHQ